MAQPLTLITKFPSTKDIKPDVYSLNVISPAYSSPMGELNSILQYFYHYFNFEKAGKAEQAKLLESIAIAEMMHFKQLGKLILALGSRPVFCQNPPTTFNFYSTKYVTYSNDLKCMIEDDIRAESHAISQYTKMIKLLVNPQIKEVISLLLADEELHLAKLREILPAL